MMQRALGLLTALPFVVLALASPVVARSTCVNYDEKLHWVKNVDLPAINVKLQGDLAYVLSNDNPRTLHILDLSDSSHPTELGVYPFEIGYRVFAVSGDLLVVGGYTQIQVVDVSNPSAPITRSVIPWGRSLADLAVLDHLCVAVGIEPGEGYPPPPGALRAYDLSNPDAPVEVQSLAFPERASRVELRDNRAFVGNQVPELEYDVFGELRIYEIAPAWRLIGKVSLHGAPDCIGLHESTAYVGEGYVLKAIDFSDEATPHVTAALSVGTITTEAKVLGDTLYTATGCGLNSYDLHVPTSPAPLPSLTGLKYADRMAVDRTRAVIAQSTTLSVFTRPAAGMAPTLGHADVPGWISDLALLGDHAVVSTFDRGIRVVNVSDPSAPYVEGFAYSAFAVYEVELVGNYAVTASSSGGVRIFDLSNPGAPQFVRAVNAPTSSYSVAVSGSYAFVPCGTSLLTIDLHDPPNATIVATTDLGSYYGHIVIGNGVAYISDQGSPALLAVDISDPWNPALVAQVESPSFIDLFLTEDRLYGVVGSGDVYPFDLTVPSSPIALPPLGVTDALAFAAGEGAAVVQHAYPRATLLDLSDPLMPRGVGSVSDGACGDGTYFGSAVAERDAIFYLGVGTQGLWTLARPCLTSEAPENSPPVAPPRPFLVGGPNPFRPALSAAFHIEARGVNVARAPIDIVNAGGRLVRRLDFGEPDVLRQHVEWDGRDDGGQPCPSGVYLFRTPSSRTSGRVIVIR